MDAFADTYFFIALIDRSEPGHRRAAILEEEYSLVATSDFVLLETLNYFSGAKRHLRLQAALLIQELPNKLGYHVVACDRELFDAAVLLYAKRPDKGWSVTDCSSFLIMEDLGLTSALTADKHFRQAGFRTLFEG